MIYNLKNPKHRKLYLSDVEKNLKDNKEVEMFSKGEKRRNKANKLYWAWMHCLQDETGQEKNDFHDYFKAMYLGTAEKEVFGIVVTKEVSTANLRVKPFWEYMQKVQITAAVEFSCVLPLPEHKGYDEFIRKYHWVFY